ncbi:MAG: magnesium transporter [Candidatus Omnitrophota bacterium]|jgi:magnesium transporter
MKPPTDLEKWKALAAADPNQAAGEFASLSPEEAGAWVKELGPGYFSDLLLRLATDAGAIMLRNFPEKLRSGVLEKLPAGKAAFLKELLSYKPGTAGALMAKEHVAVPADCDMKGATAYLQSLPQDLKGKVSYIYVVNREQRLEGVIQVRDLIFYPPDKPVTDILRKPVVQVETGMTQLEVARLLQRHRYLGLPVVDQAQRLVGVVSADRALRVLEEEAADDIAKIVGTSAGEHRTQSVRRVLAMRLPWLLVNIVSGLLCALIMGIFQENIRTVAALFLFIPVVLAMSESTGVQGATIIVHNLATGSFVFQNLRSLFLREILAGILIGLVCGGIVGSTAGWWKANPGLGLALACSMTVTIIFSALIGLFLPLLFKRFRFDPAMASGPLVLAICDLQTLFVYFTLSSAILNA